MSINKAQLPTSHPRANNPDQVAISASSSLLEQKRLFVAVAAGENSREFEVEILHCAFQEAGENVEDPGDLRNARLAYCFVSCCVAANLSGRLPGQFVNKSVEVIPCSCLFAYVYQTPCSLRIS